MSAVMFPVGHYNGVLPSAIGAPNHVVRVGMAHHRLTAAEFTAWMLAHGLGDAAGEPWTSRQIVRQGNELGLDDIAEDLTELAGRGLVVPIDAADPDIADLAGSYQLHGLMIGLGDTAERPGHHRIGLPETGTVAVLDPDSYELWRWARTTPSLWASCTLRAALTSTTDRVDDPITAVGGVLRDVRNLVAQGCGYLDVVR
ncbi:hypothetical protein E1263_06225 [Kribbella antibiotica]|uniref:Uncharacterized protein n=1 Tax=Kribbella antibiotica TaxID=190195 RepID=A0A4R4ZTW6_9ACTN|nr:hypothetical protein [Kribbella antibiotica]TDD61786.1 hypothetical protein E1263_06225 [Kribbella antibiotica]